MNKNIEKNPQPHPCQETERAVREMFGKVYSSLGEGNRKDCDSWGTARFVALEAMREVAVKYGIKIV